MTQEQVVIEALRKALEDIMNIPFVTPAAYHIASNVLFSTKNVING